MSGLLVEDERLCRRREGELNVLPDKILNPLSLMRTDRELARQRHDAAADFACFATVDASGEPHARFVTLRVINGEHVTFRASGSSPKVHQLQSNGSYELTAYWPSLARQYRLRGTYEWIAASEFPVDYAAVPWRPKVWDWLHEELPQSATVSDRSHFVDRFESCGAGLERFFGNQNAVPPPPSAGIVRLEPQLVEVQALDTEHRLHDRRVLSRAGDGWSQVILVP
jgi:pyridoxamine 5'-phosphate oxidase